MRNHWNALRGHRLVGESAWVVAGSLFHALTGLVAIRAYTELARPEVYSEANLVLGVLLLAVTFFVAPVGHGIARYYTEWLPGGTARAAWHCSVQLALFGTAIGAVALILGLSTFFGQQWSMLVLIIPFLLAQAWRTLALSAVNASRRQKDYALWLGAEALLSILATALCLALASRPEAFILGQLLGTAGAAWLFRRLVLRKVLPTSDARGSQAADHRVQLLRYGLPFMPIAVVTWLLIMGERYTLSALADLETAGRYIAVAALAARPGALVAGTLSNLFRPILFGARNRGDHKRQRQVVLLWAGAALFFGLVLVGTFLALGDVLAFLLLARDYREGAAALMAIIALGSTAYALATVAENVILASGQSSRLFLPLLIGGAINILAGLMWIPSLGTYGAAWCSAAGFGAELLASILVALSISGVHTVNKAS